MLSRIKQERSETYDNSVDYRIMEEIRNYVQHRGYPIHAIGYSGQWIGDGVKYRNIVVPSINVSELAKDENIKKKYY